MRKLIVNPKAELKIRVAMKHADSLEIMWFGEIKQNKKGDFILKDVFFPPQKNKPAYVETDDDRYPKWQFETFIKSNKQNQIRLQGHTHPYFDTTPSSIDQRQVNTFLEESKDYYIQMIVGNAHKPHCAMYTIDGHSEKIQIVWQYTYKIKKIMEEMMNYEYNETPRLF